MVPVTVIDTGTREWGNESNVLAVYFYDFNDHRYVGYTDEGNAVDGNAVFFDA